MVGNAYLWSLANEYVVDIGIWIVDAFRTIYQRSALEGHSSIVVLHIGIGYNGAWLHVEVYSHHIAFLPLPFYGEISLLNLTLHLFAIDRYGITQLFFVAVFVEVAWHYLAPYPSRYSYLHVKVLCLRRDDFYCNVAIPWIFGCLL